VSVLLPKTILLVEDDPTLALGLCDALEFEGFRVVHAERGSDAIEHAKKSAPECIILDLMLPDLNGYQVCEEIRRFDPRTPILMLTARSQEADKIRGLDSGADDYVTKPFSVGELVARIRAVLRRTQRSTVIDLPFTIGETTIDPSAHTLQRGEESEQLSFYEVELLKLLFERKGQPVSRDDILRRVWGIDANPTNRTVDNFVVKLRKKIEAEPAQPRHILTVYGLGYKLVP
jgi:DNA-binding response OmpR family regulator